MLGAEIAAGEGGFLIFHPDLIGVGIQRLVNGIREEELARFRAVGDFWRLRIHQRFLLIFIIGCRRIQRRNLLLQLFIRLLDRLLCLIRRGILLNLIRSISHRSLRQGGQIVSAAIALWIHFFVQLVIPQADPVDPGGGDIVFRDRTPRRGILVIGGLVHVREVLDIHIGHLIHILPGELLRDRIGRIIIDRVFVILKGQGGVGAVAGKDITARIIRIPGSIDLLRQLV